MLEMI